MKGFIYKVIRKTDGAIYIGKQSRWQTKDPSLSPSDIMGIKYFTSSKLIKDDWKANPDAYSFEVLEENLTDDAVLSATEVLLITKAWEEEKKGGPTVLNQYCNERFHRSGPHSEESCLRISESKKGKKRGPLSEDWRRHIRESKKGKKRGPHSEETRRKISESLTGKRPSEETRRKLSNAHKGKKMGPPSEETRRKISESRKGRPAWNKGRPPSEETRRKISEAAKRRWRDAVR